MVTFCLVLPGRDGEIVDSNSSVADLDYSKVRAHTHWEVCTRYENKPGAGGPLYCIARVHLDRDVNFDDNFNWAVNEVRQELEFRDTCADFDHPELLSGGPVIDIGYEEEECTNGPA